MDTPTVTVRYGIEGTYLVEFKLDSGKLMGRYLEQGCNGVQAVTEWEERPMHADDPNHVAVITALNTILAAYSGLDLVTA